MDQVKPSELSSEFQVETVLKKLDSWIIDENKLVTYKWLSRTAQIGVNEAKWILSKYIELRGNKPLHVDTASKDLVEGNGQLDVSDSFNKQEKCDLIVTYCLIGVKKDSKAARIELVREEDLVIRIDSFAEPLACHVYALQKGTGSTDSHTLYIADCDVTKDSLLTSNAFSAIVYDKAILCSVEQRKLENKPEPAAETTKGISVNSAKSSESKSTSFFGNVKSSSTAGSKATVKSSKASATSEKPSASFFGRQTEKPKSTVAVKDSSTENDETTKPSKESQHSSTTEKPQAESSVDVSSKNSSNKSPTISKSNTDIADSKLLANKRRRVLDLTSSEEEEEDDDEVRRNLDCMDVENLDPQKNSDSIPVSNASDSQEQADSDKVESGVTETGTSDKTSTATGALSQTNRRLVSKTYQNEEGFIVTEKVWETVTTPISADVTDGAVNGDNTSAANENTNKDTAVGEKQGATKKPAAGNTATSGKGAKKSSKASNVGGKQQTSMMTFFKKQ